ncbi:MAG TPA: hypothetical protein VJ750_07145 [Rhizomicrobium sp.]|nr:hypothetical protein [Rhizomicrobium sp.]
MASEIVLTPSLAHPFLRPGTGPLGADEQRRKAMSRTSATVLVAVLHVLFFFAFVLSIRPFDSRNRPIIETILFLAPAGNNQDRNQLNPLPLTSGPPRLLSAPIIVPKPPPIPEANAPGASPPVDVLGSVGRALACSAGSWEHLTMVERQRCGLYPWRGVKLPNGTLVMVPRTVLPRLQEAPDTEFRINSGADRAQADVRVGIIPGQGGCPILQNTPCLHVTPNMRNALGNN